MMTQERERQIDTSALLWGVFWRSVLWYTASGMVIRRQMVSNEARLTRPNTVEAALGDALEWSIQRWVAWSGRKVRVADAPWLEGPVGKGQIGAGFYDTYAKDAGLEAVARDPEAGLLRDFGSLAGEGFEPERVHPEIRC